MKGITVLFEDEEFNRLKEAKLDSRLKWSLFILSLIDGRNKEN